MSNAWQYYVLKGFSRMVCLLSYTQVLRIGKIAGRLYYKIAVRQRKRAISQIRESLHLGLSEAEAMILSLFVKIGQTFLEVMYTPRLIAAKKNQYITIENRTYMAEALAEGKGVVLLTAHLGNWEWLGAALAMEGFPVTSIIKRQPNDQHTRLLNEYREMAGIEVFASRSTEIVSAAKALKKGKILGFIADKDDGPAGMFVEFFEKMASTPIGPAVFAKKFGSPVVPVFIVRRPTGGHKIIIQKPLRYQDTGDADRDIYRLTEQMTKVIEKTIWQYPDEWLWFQKRWNSKPINEKEKAGEEA